MTAPGAAGGAALTVNGVARALPEPPTMAALFAAVGVVAGTVVVELNGTALTRGEALAAALAAGDVVEIVRAVAGG